MDPKKLFFDQRLAGFCVYCGSEPSTRDHVPSKVLLDEPYPPNLPVVFACKRCNNGFSKDEQYLACLIECVINGSSCFTLLKRDKIKRILSENPMLASKIESIKRIDENGNVFWLPDANRIKNVVLKLARGHVAYECSEPQLDEPNYISFSPITTMSHEQIKLFNTPPIEKILPELGSRAFDRTVIANNQLHSINNGWNAIQEGRYRYLVSWSDEIKVRIVLSEYLVCEVIW